MQLSKHFKLSEFTRFKRKDLPNEVLANLIRYCTELEIIRQLCGNDPIHVTSGYRTTEHNRQVGGSINSFHLKGLAGDIKHSKLEVIEFYLIILYNMDCGVIRKGGLGYYNSHVHYDMRGVIKLWYK